MLLCFSVLSALNIAAFEYLTHFERQRKCAQQTWNSYNSVTIVTIATKLGNKTKMKHLMKRGNTLISAQHQSLTHKTIGTNPISNSMSKFLFGAL